MTYPYSVKHANGSVTNHRELRSAYRKVIEGPGMATEVRNKAIITRNKDGVTGLFRIIWSQGGLIAHVNWTTGETDEVII